MKSVICVIVKNEQRFIREWVEWHLNIGFDEIHIFEDFGSVSHTEEIKDYIEQGVVFLTPLDSGTIPIADSGYAHKNGGTKPTQSELYDWFLKKAKAEHTCDWIAFIDVDEFIEFEEGYNLKRLEEEYKDTGGVLLSWKMYGANGHIMRPEGSVVESYKGEHWTESKEGKQWGLKSLVNVNVSKGQLTVHSFEGCVHTDGGDRFSPHCYDKAWIDHFFTKSWTDWCDRIFSRGNMHNNYRTLDTFFLYNEDMLPQKKELIEATRHLHTACTTWISRDLNIISGGNLDKLTMLRKRNSERFIHK